MKPTVLLKILGAEALPDAEGAFIEMETSEGPLELRCTYEDAERLIAAQVRSIARALEQVAQRFDVSAEMRQ
jgi:hypothetical protein